MSQHGIEGNGASTLLGISGDGIWVLFASDASNLVPGDTNGVTDIFMKYLPDGAVERVSVASDGRQTNARSNDAAISDDGRYVAFYSEDTNNLFTGAIGGNHVYVRDRATERVEVASVSTGGVFGNKNSFQPAISADGRFVAFTSHSTNLVANDTNGHEDVFVHDRASFTTELVSIGHVYSGFSAIPDQADGPSRAPSISGDGRLVAFESGASNLRSDPVSGAEADDWTDVYIHDRATRRTERASVSSTGGPPNQHSGIDRPAISRNGNAVAFDSLATNLVASESAANDVLDVYVRFPSDPSTRRVSDRRIPNLFGGGGSITLQANNISYGASVSFDGRYVAFWSHATNLVSGDTNGMLDVFVRDVTGAAPTRVNLSTTGEQANGVSFDPRIRQDGAVVGFSSVATNLVPGDTNGVRDAFLRVLR